MSIIFNDHSSRGWFSSQWKREITGEFRYTPTELSRVVHSILTEILPQEIYEGKKIQDLKGRDKLNIPINSYQSRDLPSGDELIYISAKVLGSEDNDPLTFRMNTPFDTFHGSQHISHSVKEEWETDLSYRPTPKLLGYIAPLEISSFRMGIERFKSTFAALSLGYTPTVIDTVTLDCHDGRGVLNASSEALKDENELPFQEDGLVRDLIDTLNRVFKD